MKETELGKVVADYFTAPGQEVYCEVPCEGIIDVVIRRGAVVTAIECKTTFGLAVIEQAFKNRTYAHHSYVAVPRPKNGCLSHVALRICAEFGIGVLTVDLLNTDSPIREVQKPGFRRRVVTPQLPDFCKLNQAGVQHGRWTAFGWFVEDMKQWLRRKPEGLTHSELFKYCVTHYHTPSSLKSSIQKYIRSGVVKEVIYRNGRFYYDHSTNTP